MILCFVSFYPKTLFLSVPFRTREKDFLVNARHRHRVRFMTMLLEERDERISDGDDDDFDEYSLLFVITGNKGITLFISYYIFTHRRGRLLLVLLFMLPNLVAEVLQRRDASNFQIEHRRLDAF